MFVFKLLCFTLTLTIIATIRVNISWGEVEQKKCWTNEMKSKLFVAISVCLQHPDACKQGVIIDRSPYNATNTSTTIIIIPSETTASSVTKATSPTKSFETLTKTTTFKTTTTSSETTATKTTIFKTSTSATAFLNCKSQPLLDSNDHINPASKLIRLRVVKTFFYNIFWF